MRSALWALAFFCSSAFGADAKAPLTVEGLTTLGRLPDVGSVAALSPDGHSVAYAVRNTTAGADREASGKYLKNGMAIDESTGTDIWIVDTRTPAPERITDGKGSYREVVWSPDGRRLAFYSDRDGAPRLWTWDRHTNKLKRVSDALVRVSLFDGARLQWTPDGKYLIALLLPEGMTVEQAAKRGQLSARPTVQDDAVALGSTVTVWHSPAPASPSTAVAVDRRPVAVVEAFGPNARAPDGSPPDTSRMFAIMESDLALVDANTGAIRRLAEGKAAFWYAPSPDGRYIAFAHESGRFPNQRQALFDIEVASIDGGAARMVSKFSGADYGLCSWSPDGSRLAYITFGNLTRGDVHVIDIVSATDRALYTRESDDFNQLFTGMRRVHWSPDGAQIYFVAATRLWRVSARGGEPAAVTPPKWDREAAQILTTLTIDAVWTGRDDRSLTLMTIEPKTRNYGFHRIDLQTNKIRRLLEESKRYDSRVMNVLTSDSGNTIVWSAQDEAHPEDLWAADAQFKRPRRLTSLNPHIDGLALGRSRIIQYTGLGGNAYDAVLLLPPQYREGQRVPVITRVYPGPFPQANRAHVFGIEGGTDIQNMQVYASRGYAVLFPMIPQRAGTPLKDLVDGVNAVLDRVIELGIADPEKLVITGHSYGGYSTLSAITQTHRFKAAIASAGAANLISSYGWMNETGRDNSSWSEAGQGLLVGHPWAYRERYIENSPIFFLDRVNTPLLLVHGEQDDAVAVQQSDEVFVGLRRLGKTVEYRRYAGEGHVVLSRENLIDYWNAALRWVDTYVGLNDASDE